LKVKDGKSPEHLNTLCSSVFRKGFPSDAFQCFPFYTYAEDGPHRRENITDWALDQFRSHYAANLRRELPRIPFAAAGLKPGSSTDAKSGVTLSQPRTPEPPWKGGPS